MTSSTAVGRTAPSLPELLLSPSRRTKVITSSLLLAALTLVSVVAIPGLDRFHLDLLTTLFLYVAAASAWNIVGGFAGQFSIANSAFIGGGGYIAVMILRTLGWGVVPTIGLAAVGGGLIALVMGVILFRLREAYFVIGSMAVALAALIWMSNWNFTKASVGISAPISMVPSRTELYQLALALAALAVAASIVIYHSSFGLRLMSVRDDQDVADSLGLSPFRLKLAAIAISGFLTAAVGAVIAVQQITIEPFSAFSLNWSMLFIVMTVVGGLGSVWGPGLGAVVIYWAIIVQLKPFPTVSLLIEGILLIVLMKVLPGGIVGGLSRAKELAAARLSSPAGTSAPSRSVRGHPAEDDAGHRERSSAPSSTETPSAPRSFTPEYGRDADRPTRTTST